MRKDKMNRLIGLSYLYADNFYSTEEFVLHHRITLDELIKFGEEINIEENVLKKLKSKRDEYKRFVNEHKKQKS